MKSRWGNVISVQTENRNTSFFLFFFAELGLVLITEKWCQIYKIFKCTKDSRYFKSRHSVQVQRVQISKLQYQSTWISIPTEYNTSSEYQLIFTQLMTNWPYNNAQTILNTVEHSLVLFFRDFHTIDTFWKPWKKRYRK